MLCPVYMAVCDKCNYVFAAGTVGTDNMVTSSKVLIDNGWTIKGGKHFCPACSKGEVVSNISEYFSNLKKGLL